MLAIYRTKCFPRHVCACKDCARGNLWACLGNGRTEAENKVARGQLEGGEVTSGRLSPYMRTEGLPSEIEGGERRSD